MSAVTAASQTVNTFRHPVLLNPVLTDMGALGTKVVNFGLTADRQHMISALTDALDSLSLRQLMDATEANDGTLGAPVSVATFTDKILQFYEPDLEKGFGGECFVVTGVLNASTPSKLWKSVGWPTRLTTPPTWKLILDNQQTQNADFGLNRFSFGFGGKMYYSDYRSQTFAPGGGNNTLRGGQIYKSVDKGETFTSIFDIRYFNLPSGVANNTNVHLHSCAYDPWDDRLWVAFGDLNAASPLVVGVGNMQILSTDDDFATWNTYPELVEFGAAVKFQPTTIGVFKKALIFGYDGNNRVPNVVIPKLGYRKTGKPYCANFTRGVTPFTYAFNKVGKDSENFPMFYGVLRGAAAIAISLYTSEDGLSWSEAFVMESPSILSNNTGWKPPLGPTLAGKVYMDVPSYTHGGANPNGTRFTFDLGYTS